MEVRSNNLNRFYWKIVIPRLMQGLIDAGWEREIVGSSLKTHNFIKELLLLPDEYVTEKGELLIGKYTTTTTNNKIFINYIEDIQRIGAQYLNICIPDPNEISLLNFD